MPTPTSTVGEAMRAHHAIFSSSTLNRSYGSASIKTAHGLYVSLHANGCLLLRGMSNLRLHLSLHLGLLDLKTANAWTHIDHDARNHWIRQYQCFLKTKSQLFSRWKICLRPWGAKRAKRVHWLRWVHFIDFLDHKTQSTFQIYPNVSECHINSYQHGINGVGIWICQVHCNFTMWRILVRQGGHGELEIEGVGSWFKLFRYGSRCSRISRWSI